MSPQTCSFNSADEGQGVVDVYLFKWSRYVGKRSSFLPWRKCNCDKCH